MNLRIVDLSGKTIQLFKNLVSGQTLQVGANYIPGIYYVELVQGNRRKVVKLMKIPD